MEMSTEVQNYLLGNYCVSGLRYISETNIYPVTFSNSYPYNPVFPLRKIERIELDLIVQLSDSIELRSLPSYCTGNKDMVVGAGFKKKFD